MRIMAKTYYSLDRSNETLQYLEGFHGGSAYIARDVSDIYFRDSVKKLYITDLIELIKETEKKKFRNELNKTMLLEYYHNVLALLRHYRIEFMINPRPIMSELDTLALAC